MTVEILNEAPDDDEEITISWLSPLRRCAQTRRTGDPLPFTLVTHVTGKEDVDCGVVDNVVQVAVLSDKRFGEDAANHEMTVTHQRMLLLARYLEDVILHDGRTATIDYCDVFEVPTWQPYGDDQILMKVARYKLGLAYVTTELGS